MGRPRKNYNDLFSEFVKSELSKNEFLRQKQINPSCGSACRNASDWEVRRLKLLSIRPPINEPPDTALDCNSSGKETIIQVSDTVNITNLASKLSNQIESMLQQADDGAPKSLSVDEISKLTAALSQLQLVRQREKGIWAKLPYQGKDHHSQDQVESKNERLKSPIYEVQIDENGKFKRARPVLIGHEVNAIQNPSEEISDEEPHFIVQMMNPETGKFETAKPRHLLKVK